MRDVMTGTRRTPTSSERGAALLEVAMTLPLLLLVAVGIFEFGRAYQTWQILTNAAREGARVAVLPGIDDDAVEERVHQYLDAGLLDAADEADVSINRDTTVDIGDGTASASTVQVEFPSTFMALQGIADLAVNGSTLGEPLTMTTSATMRNEM
jgi:Flp pilus assembly protein TadG